MNSLNSFHLKLIPNFSYRKEKLSIPLRNKDFYLFNLLHRKNIKNKEYIKSTKNDNNIVNHNSAKKTRKLKILKELSINNFFQKINIKNKSQDESNKNLDNNFKFLFLKTKKKVQRYNSCYFSPKDKADKLESSNLIKNPLIITSFNQNNLILKMNNKNKKNKLKKLKKNLTYKTLNENELKKFNEDYFISNSINKNSSITNFKTKKSEGTQINLNYVSYNNLNNRDNYTTISRNKYCSPKSIIFQREYKKIKSLDNNRYT